MIPDAIPGNTNDRIDPPGPADPTTASMSCFGLHIGLDGHARVEAARLCHLTHIPVEWVDMEPHQEQQLATALDAPYGHWDDDKLRVRLRRLEVQDLDMDAVCLPPFDITRLLQDTAPLTPLRNPPVQDTTPPSARHSPDVPPKEPDSTPDTTGSARYVGLQTLTIRVSGDDDQLSSVYFDVDDWRSKGMEVKVVD